MTRELKAVKDACEARVVRRLDITSDLFKLALYITNPEKRKEFFFRAGQYCIIGLPKAGSSEIIWRPYSIVSAPYENSIELFVELVPPPLGNLTPLLYQLAIGDAVLLMPKAKGVFTFESKYSHQVMVATVTGIAPFISMLRDYIYRRQSGHYFYILQGASYCDEFCYDDELRGVATAQSGGVRIMYLPTVSRPNELRNQNWRCETGRVNKIVSGFLDRWSLVPSSTIIYACGHPGMVADVKKKLSPMGWKVKEEKYWK